MLIKERGIKPSMGKMKAAKWIFILTGAAILGDLYNINDRLVNPIAYRNVKTDQQCYQEPFKLQKKYVKNEKGMLEVHFGHDEKWYKVTNELRVNERSLDQMVKGQGNEIARKLKEKYDQKEPLIKEHVNRIIELYKGLFKREDGNSQ